MKITKKILAIVMAIVLLALPMLTVNAFARETIERSCPNIEVHGFMATDILQDMNDPDSKVIWPPDVNAILSEVGKALGEIMKKVKNLTWEDFATILSDSAYKAIGGAFADKDGQITDGSGVFFTYPDPELITKNCEIKFRYDWRVDPVETAAKLDAYIDYVLECSGSDKVTIEGHSFGGVILLSYLSIYGTEKIKSACFNSTAIYGETYNGDLMRGKISLDGEAIRDYMYYAFDGNDAQVLLDGIFDLLMKAGLLDGASALANKLVDKVVDVAAKKVLIPMFGQWLPIWSMVPDEYLDEALNYVFGNVYAGEDFSPLMNRIETYNRLVRDNKAETLKEINEKINVYVISRYGYSSLPITPSFLQMGDGTIDTKYSSFGATTGLYGQSLSNEYIERVDPKYISPDKTVDASTCLFPEQTWFIKNLKHSSSPDDLDDLIDGLLASDKQETVDSFGLGSRFLAYDSISETLSVDIGKTEPVIIREFRRVITRIKETFAKLLQKLFFWKAK